ncbi:hypothetical protein, partial [Nocardia gipuzkoensis]
DHIVQTRRDSFLLVGTECIDQDTADRRQVSGRDFFEATAAVGVSPAITPRTSVGHVSRRTRPAFSSCVI